mgnify:CR=1 FL=1
MTAQKVLLLYSGGLDSRLSLKLLKNKGYKIRASFFQIPFNAEHSGNDIFLQNEEVPLDIFDCTRGKLFKDYMELLKKPLHGRGSGYNPCLDCKLFMLKHASEYAKKHNYQALATGEVPGQRPMSQTKNKMRIVRETIDMPIIRPLAEEGIEGRSRKHQMNLAEQYNIDYPSPAGGCLLCEKELKIRFKTLIEKDIIQENTSPLISLGRHYYFPEMQSWMVVGRVKPENDVIEQFTNFIKSGKGKPAVYYEAPTPEKMNKAEKTAMELQKAFQDKDREKINYFANWKL